MAVAWGHYVLGAQERAQRSQPRARPHWAQPCQPMAPPPPPPPRQGVRQAEAFQPSSCSGSGVRLLFPTESKRKVTFARQLASQHPLPQSRPIVPNFSPVPSACVADIASAVASCDSIVADARQKKEQWRYKPARAPQPSAAKLPNLEEQQQHILRLEEELRDLKIAGADLARKAHCPYKARSQIVLQGGRPRPPAKLPPIT